MTLQNLDQIQDSTLLLSENFHILLLLQNVIWVFWHQFAALLIKLFFRNVEILINV